jgi:hypothetical protein
LIGNFVLKPFINFARIFVSNSSKPIKTRTPNVFGQAEEEDTSASGLAKQVALLYLKFMKTKQRQKTL